MITFFVALAILIIGYCVWGKIVEKIFQPTDAPTPCMQHPDGVDYVPMKKWRLFLIQLLNIAGLGPIFGALSGALWGPIVYFWIVLGTIFAGAVHDYACGMLSMRHNGASIAEIIGIYLGKFVQNIMRVFSVILLVMVGVVFAVGPAGLLALLTPSTLSVGFWTVIVFAYYLIATIFPVDKIIGKIYPLFGICLIVMALGVAGSTIVHSGTRPMMEMTLENLHPAGKSWWPFMFITVACGAISGFHSTQSPIVARCVKSEKEGRQIFYGAMVAEGIIALIWASAGIAFYYKTDGGLLALLEAGGGNSAVVYEMCKELLGPVGCVFAMLGVIACPITSGDTAFRSARLTIADWFKIDQSGKKKRILLAVPLLAAGVIISRFDYQIIWRYFSWSNQTLAMMALWAAATYIGTKKSKKASLVFAIPATFMTAVTTTYILIAEEGFRLSSSIGYTAGIILAILFAGIFIAKVLLKPMKDDHEGDLTSQA